MGPFLAFVGVVMVVTGAKGTHVALGNQLVKDFTGEKNFIYWVIAIGILGLIAKVPGAEKVSRPFIILVVSAMLLKNDGFFQKFFEAINAGPIAPPREQMASAGSDATNKTGGNNPLANIDLNDAATIATRLAVGM